MSDSLLPADNPDGAAAAADAGGERRPTDVLVVGGAGFIGSHLVDRLVAEQAAVEVADDLSSGSLANLAGARGGRTAQRWRAAHPHPRCDVAGPRHAGDAAATTSRRPPRPARARFLAGRRSRAFVHLDVGNPRSRPRRVRGEGHRRPPGNGAVRHTVGAPTPGQGGRDHAARCAWRRRQGDRRPVDHVPRGARHRVHRARRHDGVRPTPATPPRRRCPPSRRRRAR